MQIWEREERDSPEAVGRESALLGREIRRVAHPHRVPQLRLDIEKRLECSRLLLRRRRRVLDAVLYREPDPTTIRKTLNQAGVVVIAFSSVEIRECLQLLRHGGDVVEDLAAVERCLLEGAEVEASDDAEVVGATTKGDPEVAVGSRVGIDDVAGCQDDLEIDDIIADEAVAGTEKGKAAC